jgi:hypothetical protein
MSPYTGLRAHIIAAVHLSSAHRVFSKKNYHAKSFQQKTSVVPPPHAMENLSEVLLEKLAMHVTMARENPMEDLVNLLSTCTNMSKACRRAIVAWSIPLDQVLHWRVNDCGLLYYSREYHADLVTKLVKVGNPEACFIAGMSVVFMEGHSTVSPPLDMQKLAADSG